MKNTAIIIAIAVIAYLIYHFSVKSDSSQVSNSNEIVPKTVETTTDIPASLISKSAEGADVFIMEPGDGTTVSSPVTIKFGLTNMTVAKAGDNTEYSGHHHLLINLDALPPLDAPLPATEQIIHFGGGQTETTIDLEPGQHTLQLLLGNYLHIPHDTPVLSKKITITVE